MGNKIKVAIARMMAVLMVMTLIPVDMLVPARVAKAETVTVNGVTTITEDGVTTKITEDTGTTEWDFTNCPQNKDLKDFTEIGGLRAVSGTLKVKSSDKCLEMQNPSVIDIPLQADTTKVELYISIPKQKDGYLQVGSVRAYSNNNRLKADSDTDVTKILFSNTSGENKMGTFEQDDFGTTDNNAKYLRITVGGNTVQVSKIRIVETAGTPKASAPTPSIESGTEVLEGAKLTLTSATDDAVIYYTCTKDGSEPADPTAESEPYPEDGITLDGVGTIKIKAIAISATADDSKVVTFTYTVKEETISEPTPSIDSDTKVAKGTKLALETETEDAVIYYTLNGNEPTESSTKYTGEFSLGSETGTVTVKAIAIKGTKKSSVVSFKYTITGDKLAMPTATPAAGEVARGTKVTLSCSSDGGGNSLYYEWFDTE